jgi:broad specificity phosphatase PhoE
MKTLYFVRHAESEANVLNILGGQSDFALSDRGRADAALLAERFTARYGADLIVSSPLRRARETAEPFSIRLGLEVAPDPALMEQNMGVFSGLSYAEAEADPRYERDRTKRWDWTPPGGESYRAMADRIRPFFATVDKLADGTRLLCFTHAVTLRIVIGLLEDTLPAYPTSLTRNGEILAVEYTGLGKTHAVVSQYYGDQTDGRE